MSKKKKQNYEPHGLWGRVFQFTYDDLISNRLGHMTHFQQFEFKFWERKAFGWVLSLPPLKWLKLHEVVKITGKVKKQFTSRIIMTGSERSGGGQLVLEKWHIQILASNETANFYVNKKQFHALPENGKLTLYYDPMGNRIVSVEPP